MNLGPLARYQGRALDLAAVLAQPRAAVGFKHLAMGSKPSRVVQATREHPAARKPVAALDGGSPALSTGAPGENRLTRTEDAARNNGLEGRSRHGAPGRLAKAPGGARIGSGNDLGNLRQR